MHKIKIYKRQSKNRRVYKKRKIKKTDNIFNIFMSSEMVNNELAAPTILTAIARKLSQRNQIHL